MPVGPIPLPPGRIEELVRLTNRVFRARGGDMGREYPLVFDPDRPEGMRVILEDDKIVSHVGVAVRDASLLGVPLRVASIGAVCTDPEYRGRGFAGALMEDATAFALQQKCQLMLISGDRPLYRRLGAVRPGRFTRIEVAVADLPPGYSLDRAGEADIPELIRLYQREPVRFLRHPDYWRRLLYAAMLMNSPADCWLVLDREDSMANLALQRTAGDHLPTVR
ncbi:MAG: GNAT family N-acetyltransferase [Armatimonadetes bacterium]|nr:GNAT family N-acetyltransferase [Armatimonadota bacterium]